MTEPFIYWRSKDGGPWERIDVPGVRSPVHWQLARLPFGEVWDDGYGNRYRCELAEP